MQQILFSLLFSVLVSTSVSAQVRMRWKVSPEHPVYYQTVLNVTETSDVIFSGTETPDAVITRENTSQFFDLFGKKPSYALVRHAGENVVDVKITQSLEASGVGAEKVEALKTDLGMVENVILRGQVFADGGIRTYFIENQQKSLLAAAFELPARPVQKGDTWTIDFSCMDIRGVMTTDTIVRNLNVKAEDIYTTPEGDTMVVVTYDLYERLIATSRSYKKKGDMLTSMRVKYVGRGTFSINQGRWVAYHAVFSLESLGMMTAKMKGVYGLMPVDDVPEVFKQD